jgi:hypothetical protein
MAVTHFFEGEQTTDQALQPNPKAKSTLELPCVFVQCKMQLTRRPASRSLDFQGL